MAVRIYERVQLLGVEPTVYDQGSLVDSHPKTKWGMFGFLRRDGLYLPSTYLAVLGGIVTDRFVGLQFFDQNNEQAGIIATPATKVEGTYDYLTLSNQQELNDHMAYQTQLYDARCRDLLGRQSAGELIKMNALRDLDILMAENR